MGDNNLSDEQQQSITLFMEISDSDYDTAVQILTATNFDVQQAVNLHLERLNEPTGSNNILPEDRVAAASTSTGNPNLPIDDGEEEVRAPILPKREQLIMPNEDNFRPYRKRRTAAPRTVCPLRNFELEGRMQEERLNAVAMSNFAEEADDGFAFGDVPNTSSTTPRPLGFATATTQAARASKMVATAQAAKPSTGPSRLSELFRPPVDITFCGSFQAVRDYAKEQNRWLIVNLQDMSDFGCQVLNRDIWSNEQLRKIIKKYFVFWQVAIDNSDGHRYQVFYSVSSYPYVGIIDPRTGEEKLNWNGFKQPCGEFISDLKDYLKMNTPYPDSETIDSTPAAIDKCECFNAKPSSSTNSSALEGPSVKRKRVEPSSLSEQEQIALAIANSVREINDDNNDESSLDEDDSDFENFDDESSSQSFAKTPTSLVTSAVANSNNGVKSEVVECDTNNIGSTTDESYEDYLGDDNDPKARIQLRLPNGDRHIVEWPCSAKLKALKMYLPLKYPELTADNEYKVICPFVGGASNNVLDMDEVLTLQQANLYPSAILHLRTDD